MVTDAIHPLARPAAGAFQRALSYGAPTNVRWEAGRQRWRVESQSDPGSFRYVQRRRPLVERPFDPDRKPNPAGWFFALACDCPAGNPRDGSTPKIICWHKAAVVFWCAAYRVLDPVVQRDRYDAALRRHEGRLKAWFDAVGRGEIDVSRFLTTGNDPLPLGDGEWLLHAEDLELLPPDPTTNPVVLRDDYHQRSARELPW